MSTNDQSNPSPNTLLGAANNMQVRTQILKGLTAREAMEQYEGELTAFEMSEIAAYDFIFTVGSIRIESMS